VTRGNPIRPFPVLACALAAVCASTTRLRILFPCFLTITLCLCALGLAAPQGQRKQIDLEEVLLVSRSNHSVWSYQDDVEAKVGDTVFIYAIVRSSIDGRSVYFGEADSVRLGRERIAVNRFPEQLGRLEIRWFSVKAVDDWYVNEPGKAVTPVLVEDLVHRGWVLKTGDRPGTFRFKVHINNGVDTVSSPGKESQRPGGLLPGVLRVSVREDKHAGDNVDYMTLFLNVPYIWGSTRRQVDSFVGVDCQDLVIYGLNRTGYDLSYDRHIHITQKEHFVFEGFLGSDGKTYDKENGAREAPIRRGDIIRFPDVRHYAAIYEDTSPSGEPNGKLDMSDKVIESFGKVDILRLDSADYMDPPMRIQVFRF
jgi:hypothetical protein